MKIWRIGIGIMALAWVAMGGTAVAGDQIVIKFSHVVAKDTPKGKAADKFAELAASYTKERVKVEVYPNSQLFKDKEELEAVQMGTVQMLAPSLAKFGPLGVKEFEVFDLPFMFDNYEQLHKITYGPIGQALLARLSSKGLLGLAYWDNGFKQMSANKPLRNVEDFKGLKMRIQSSKVLDAQMRALGANPQVMAFSEVYQALQTGVVDGTENPASNFYTQKMHEVQKYMSLSDHGYLGYAVIVNKPFWEGLPPEVRAQLDRALADATVYANQIAKQENDNAIEAVRKSGKTQVSLLTNEERAAWKKVLVKVHQEMANRIGGELIQSIHMATGFDPNKP
ncbi:MAG: TRAP transporter substrate-binding protein [Magnetococcales bacterium]|nr:TRAP transporter substrate-binding protein [Magnetococcales bacterium]MBF0262159.1 TRAP transporter substrate-binding protein [Magnetococcales bacterium]